jgi:hypothetical protein
MSEPRTEAGRRLLGELSESPLPGARYAHHVASLRIAAIEAEAAAIVTDRWLNNIEEAASSSDELRAALDELGRTHPSDPDNSPLFWDGWHAALAAVEVALSSKPSAEPE